MSTRVAVTGAGGFVGGHVLSHAAERGIEVAAVVRSAEAAARASAAGATPVLVRGLERAALARAFAGAVAVVHLAQIGSERPGATLEEVNVHGTRAVAQAARDAGVARVVLLSGLGVARYGLSPRSTNRYFLSKLRAESELFGADVAATVLRPSYVLGPGDGLITGMLRDLAAGVVEFPGDGSYRLQPVAVADAADAVIAAALAAGRTPAAPPIASSTSSAPSRSATPRSSSGWRAWRAIRVGGREHVTRTVSVAEAEPQGPGGRLSRARPGGRGRPAVRRGRGRRAGLERLLGRALLPLDRAIEAAVQGTR